jgi:hypothetical protein
VRAASTTTAKRKPRHSVLTCAMLPRPSPPSWKAAAAASAAAKAERAAEEKAAAAEAGRAAEEEAGAAAEAERLAAEQQQQRAAGAAALSPEAERRLTRAAYPSLGATGPSAARPKVSPAAAMRQFSGAVAPHHSDEHADLASTPTSAAAGPSGPDVSAHSASSADARLRSDGRGEAAKAKVLQAQLAEMWAQMAAQQTLMAQQQAASEAEATAAADAMAALRAQTAAQLAGQQASAQRQAAAAQSIAAQQRILNQQQAAYKENATARTASAVRSAAAGWAAAERAATDRVAAARGAAEAAAAAGAAASAEKDAAEAALAEVSAAARLSGEAGPSTGTIDAGGSSALGGVAHGGRAAGTPAAATGALLQVAAMRWLTLMQADPLVCGRLAEVLAEMQEVQLQQDECTVCMDRPCSVTLLPCGHRVLCTACCSGVRAGNDKVRVGAAARALAHDVGRLGSQLWAPCCGPVCTRRIVAAHARLSRVPGV